MFSFGKNKLSYESLAQEMSEGSVQVIDVRGLDEFKSGHIPGAIHIPVNIVDMKIQDYISDKNANIVVYCLSGGRAGMAMNALKAQGYTNVRNFGGVSSWKGQLEI